MSNSEQPQEPEKALYQRDKTAQEPKVSVDTETKPKPKPKLRKAFVPKKLVKIIDKPKNTVHDISEFLLLNPLIFFVRPLLTFKRNWPLSLLMTLTSLSMIKPRWKIISSVSPKNIALAQPRFLGEIWIGSIKV